MFNAHPHIAAALCENGADPMAADRSGVTPLHDAASVGCCRCVLLLLLRVGEVGSMTCAVEARDSAGMTPIFTALSASAMHAASLLLAAGADIDAVDNRGVRPRDMLRLSVENERGAPSSISSALAHIEKMHGGENLVRRFKELSFVESQPF